MKKNKFLSGLGATLALAAVAVAPMFTSCSNESIEINVKQVDATFQILPTVLYDGVDVTSQATITYSDNSTGKYSGTTISAATVNVTATYNGKSDTKSVNIPALSAAQSQAVTVLFVLQSDPVVPETPVTTYSYDFDQVLAGTATEAKQETIVLKDNTSDYWLTYTSTFDATTTVTVSDVKVYNNDADVAAIKDAAEKKFAASSTTTEKFESFVGAWSRLEATLWTVTTEDVYNVVETATTKATETNVVATITVKTVSTKISAEGNLQIPGHSHAPAGHGHGHGDDVNAGGGIVFGE